MYSFKDYLDVDYTQPDDELLALKAKRRKIDDATAPIKKIAKKLLPKLRIADREKKAAAKAGGAD
jgi:hypothetical protein